MLIAQSQTNATNRHSFVHLLISAFQLLAEILNIAYKYSSLKREQRSLLLYFIIENVCSYTRVFVKAAIISYANCPIFLNLDTEDYHNNEVH